MVPTIHSAADWTQLASYLLLQEYTTCPKAQTHWLQPEAGKLAARVRWKTGKRGNTRIWEAQTEKSLATRREQNYLAKQNWHNQLCMVQLREFDDHHHLPRSSCTSGCWSSKFPKESWYPMHNWSWTTLLDLEMTTISIFFPIFFSFPPHCDPTKPPLLCVTVSPKMHSVGECQEHSPAYCKR